MSVSNTKTEGSEPLLRNSIVRIQLAKLPPSLSNETSECRPNHEAERFQESGLRRVLFTTKGRKLGLVMGYVMLVHGSLISFGRSHPSTQDHETGAARLITCKLGRGAEGT